MAETLRIDTEEFEAVKRKLLSFKGEHKRIMARGINRAAGTARKAVSAEIRKRYRGVKDAEITGKETMRVTKAKTKGLAAEIVLRGGPRPLYKFSVSPRTILTKKGKKPKNYKSAVLKDKKLKVPSPTKGASGIFIATMENGHTGVFVRNGIKKFSLKGIKRTIRRKIQGKKKDPIDERFGPSIPQMFYNKKNPEVMDAVKEKTHAMLVKTVNHEVKRFLESRGES